MANVQKTYGLTALGFVVALFFGMFIWFPAIATAMIHIGTAGTILLAILAFIPLFVVLSKPNLWTYLLFAAVTEGYVLSVIPAYAAYLGTVVVGIAVGAAIALALVGTALDQRQYGGRLANVAFWAIIASLLGSIVLLVGGILGWYSWHLDLGAAVLGLLGFALFAIYDASKIRQYDNEYYAAVRLLIDIVGIVVELLRLILLFQRRD